jgi:Tfp pilus assembly protein PilN
MMRRIDLLPSAYAERRRQRRNVALVVVVGIALLAAQIAWWFGLGGQVDDAKSDLEQAKAQNVALQSQINELQRFAELEQEVEGKRLSLQAVMDGDLDWPGLLTELALVVPGEVWLVNLTASAGETEGATQVGTESAEVDIAPQGTVGRIQFTGKSLSMVGVAKWLLRLRTVQSFTAIYLTNAVASEDETGTSVVDFDSSLELGRKALSDRFTEGGR